MVIPVTQVRLNLVNVSGPTKAVGSVTFGNAFVVHGVRVVEASRGGLFVAMPQEKRNGEYRDLFHPITGEFRARLNSAVMEMYEKLREREDRER